MDIIKKRPMRKNPNGQNDYNTNRNFLNANIRAVSSDGEEKTKEFELSFSSEEPYMRWYGAEILDHSAGAVDLSRLKSIGVMLFNHNTNDLACKQWTSSLLRLCPAVYSGLPDIAIDI